MNSKRWHTGIWLAVLHATSCQCLRSDHKLRQKFCYGYITQKTERKMVVVVGVVMVCPWPTSCEGKLLYHRSWRKAGCIFPCRHYLVLFCLPFSFFLSCLPPINPLPTVCQADFCSLYNFFPTLQLYIIVLPIHPPHFLKYLHLLVIFPSIIVLSIIIVFSHNPLKLSSVCVALPSISTRFPFVS